MDILKFKVDNHNVEVYKIEDNLFKVYFQYDNNYLQTEFFYALPDDLILACNKATKRQKDMIVNKIKREVEKGRF